MDMLLSRLGVYFLIFLSNVVRIGASIKGLVVTVDREC
jgi:hypothetical protein